MVALELKQIHVPPGQWILLEGVNWQQFESILYELGEHRSSHIAYYQENLEIMTPLPEHERVKVILGDLIKILLDELEMNWESLGSTTFKREEMRAGIEPDDCFYIKNYQRMIGRDRIDLKIDPPPDLAIEVDLTSKTKIDAYQALKVPEIWRYTEGHLEIYVLQEDQYIVSPISLIFPDFPIKEEIIRFLDMSRSLGTSQTLRGFRQWIRSANY